MLSWFSCCSQAEDGEDQNQADLAAHRRIVTSKTEKQVSILESLSANSSATMASDSTSTEPLCSIKLPDLDVSSPPPLPLALRRNRTDETGYCAQTPAVQTFSASRLPRRSTSAEPIREEEKVIQRHVVRSTSSSSSSSSSSSRSKTVTPTTATARPTQVCPMRTNEMDGEVFDSQSVMYSSWFALLSKSLNSEGVSSPSWLVNPNKQIEGA